MPPMAPDPEVGKQSCKNSKNLTEMSPEEVLETVKNKTVEAGGKVYDFGGRAINTIQEKISNGQIK